MVSSPANIVAREVGAIGLNDPYRTRENFRPVNNFCRLPAKLAVRVAAAAPDALPRMGKPCPAAHSARCSVPGQTARGKSHVRNPGRSLPIKVNSPRTTLSICGKVSIRAQRRNRCTRGTPPPRFAVVRKSNVQIHRPLRQTRTRRRSTGPSPSALMTSATAASNGSKNPIAKHRRKASKTRQQRMPPISRIATILFPTRASLFRRQGRAKCFKIRYPFCDRRGANQAARPVSAGARFPRPGGPAPPREPDRCARRGVAPVGWARAGQPRNRAAGRASDSGRCRAGPPRRKAGFAASSAGRRAPIRRNPETAPRGRRCRRMPPVSRRGSFGAPARQQRRDRVARLVAAGLGIEIDLQHVADHRQFVVRPVARPIARHCLGVSAMIITRRPSAVANRARSCRTDRCRSPAALGR